MWNTSNNSKIKLSTLYTSYPQFLWICYWSFITKPSKRRSQGFKRERALTRRIFVSIFPRLTLSLFTTDKEVIEMSVIYIILVAANLFGKSGNIIFGNGIRDYGDTKWMFFTQVLGTVGVVGLAFLCVFVFKLGMLGVFIAVLCDEAIRAVINFIRFLRIKF